MKMLKKDDEKRRWIGFMGYLKFVFDYVNMKTLLCPFVFCIVGTRLACMATVAATRNTRRVRLEGHCNCALSRLPSCFRCGSSMVFGLRDLQVTGVHRRICRLACLISIDTLCCRIRLILQLLTHYFHNPFSHPFKCYFYYYYY